MSITCPRSENKGQDNQCFVTWRIFLEICEGRSTPPVYLTRPEMFRSGLETAKRRNVLKELHLRGICLHDLMEICPMSVRALEYAIYGRK